MSGIANFRDKRFAKEVCDSFDSLSDEYIEVEEKSSTFSRGNVVPMTERPTPSKNQAFPVSTKTVTQPEVSHNWFSVSKLRDCLAVTFGILSSTLLIFMSILLILLYIQRFPSDRSEATGNMSSFLEVLSETLIDNRESLRQAILSSHSMNFSSCVDILYHNSSSTSGYYLVRSSTGQLVSVYCDMTRSCGNITGGWMRVAELDLDYCFTGLKPKSFDGNRTCVVNNDTAGCTPVQFSLFNIQYSKVCGKIRGYGVGTVDDVRGRNIDDARVTDNYLDGISVSSNGNHIWSFAAGPCSNCIIKPNFIKNDWTCDRTFCDPGVICGPLLWNTSICGEGGTFFRKFPSSIDTDITMNVCRDEDRDNEDIAISVVELYVH